MPGAHPALRVDQVASLPNLTSGAFVQRTDFELPFFFFYFFLYFRGGLGVGVRGLHAVNNSGARTEYRRLHLLLRFLFEKFLVSHGIMGLATAHGPFRPAVYHSSVSREAGRV